jgi:hypothetical protein
MKTKAIALAIVIALGLSLTTIFSQQKQTDNKQTAAPVSKEAFEKVPPLPVIEQAIGIADLAFGETPDGPGETLAFTGPVKVQKWPMDGYTRKVLDDGRVQITAEIVDRDKGNLLARSAVSYMLKAPVRITVAPGYPDEKGAATSVQPSQFSKFQRRSMGTITQLKPGVDFPAVVEMNLYLNVHAPNGVLHNEDPIILKTTVDGLPPVKITSTKEGFNEWHASNMPIRFVDDEGKTRAWMTTRAHTACLVHPNTISQLDVEATVMVKANGKAEQVKLRGMSEIHQYNPESPNARLEMVQLYLTGDSPLLGGAVMLSSPNEGCRRVPLGGYTEQGRLWFDLPLVFKTSAGLLRTEDTVRVEATPNGLQIRKTFFGQGEAHLLRNEQGQEVGSVTDVTFRILGKFEHPPTRGMRFLP